MDNAILNIQAHILLIDDEEHLLNALKAALVADGIDVVITTKSNEVLSILDTNNQIDVIISDIRMPGMDGITLLKAVRETYNERSWLQVIFMTGHATLENSVEALRLEAVDFLYKPVRRPEFIKAVRKALNKAAEQRFSEDLRTHGAERLAKLIDEATALSNRLTGRNQIKASQDDNEKHSVPKALSKERLIELTQANRLKNKLFNEVMFSEPAWNMLTEIFRQQLLDRKVMVSAIHASSGAPMATASRRLIDMEEASLIKRTADSSDKRRSFVELMPKTYDLLVRYFEAIESI